jgi:hypothetical protein
LKLEALVEELRAKFAQDLADANDQIEGLGDEKAELQLRV